MVHLRWIVAATISVCCFAWSEVCLSAAGQDAEQVRDVKLVLHPQKVPAAVGEFPLLPPESKMIDGDAFPLYEKAIKALPDRAGDKQIREWLKMPISQLPLDQVKKAVVDRTASLQAVNRAVKCRQCNWPQSSGTAEDHVMSGYSRLARVIQLWARWETASGGYEGAIVALQAGFGMTRHLGQVPTRGARQCAGRIGQDLCGEVEGLVQIADAPNLSLALAKLSGLMGDIEKVLEDDKKRAMSELSGKFSSKQIEDGIKMPHGQVRAYAKGYETHLAALQCVEAIRSYAASHKGKLPAVLADITEVSAPKDPTVDGPFRYTLSGSTAILEFSLPAGLQSTEVTMENVRYEISIGK